MRDVFTLIKQINELTLKIEFQYPELYKNLDEESLRLQRDSGNAMSTYALYNYLTGLKEMVSRYEQSHLKKTG